MEETKNIVSVSLIFNVGVIGYVLCKETLYRDRLTIGPIFDYLKVLIDLYSYLYILLFLLKGNPRYGFWMEGKRNDRCILKCFVGFEPSGCHVIRYHYWTKKWNLFVPTCQEVKGMSKSHVNTPSPPSLLRVSQFRDNNLITCGNSSTESPM